MNGLSGRTPWHQDAAVLSKKGQRLTDMVTVWIPFTKTTIKEWLHDNSRENSTE